MLFFDFRTRSDCKFGLFFYIFCLVFGSLNPVISLQAAELRIAVASSDPRAARCSILGFSGIFENESLSLTFQPLGFPANAKLTFESFATFDGLALPSDQLLNRRFKSTQNNLTLTTGKVLPQLDFATLSVLVEARDEQGNYASSRFGFNVYRKFILERDRLHKSNCAETSAGEVVSGLEENQTSRNRRVKMEDSRIEDFYSQVQQYQGFYLSLKPTLADLTLIGFNSANEFIKTNFRSVSLGQYRTIEKDLAPSHFAFLVRRFRTSYDVYKILEVGTCGQMIHRSNAVYSESLPQYDWAFIDDPNSNPFDQIDKNKIQLSINTCQVDFRHSQDWVFLKAIP